MPTGKFFYNSKVSKVGNNKVKQNKNFRTKRGREWKPLQQTLNN